MAHVMVGLQKQNKEKWGKAKTSLNKENTY